MNRTALECHLGKQNYYIPYIYLYFVCFYSWTFCNLAFLGSSCCSCAITLIEKMITLKSLLMIIIFHLFRAIHHKILSKLVDKVMHVNFFAIHGNTSTSGEECGSCLTVHSSNKQLQESEKMWEFLLICQESWCRRWLFAAEVICSKPW